MKSFILQAVADENHASAVNKLLASNSSDRFIVSTAFMTEAGLSLISETLAPVAKKTEIFVGIRNGITTAQSLEVALEMGCRVFTVDTGLRTRIFHPKLYYGANSKSAEIIVGSANLTVGGLSGNIEASLHEALSLDAAHDHAFAAQLEEKFLALKTEHPDHVVQIVDQAGIDDLLGSGRVVDEDAVSRPAVSGSSSNREKDQLRRMALASVLRPKRTKTNRKAAQPVAQTASGKPVKPAGSGLVLLWESGELKRRDLDIPVSENTNQTGSMLWKKGNSDIDQQTYFRDSVFNQLNWRPDQRTQGKELAEADFQIVIRGIDYGVHTLTVTHDTRTDTRSYEQKQPMSAVRWGEARSLIAREDLLERTMRLYQDPAADSVFVIDID